MGETNATSAVKYTDDYPYYLSLSTHHTPGIYSLTYWTYIYVPCYDSLLGIKYSRENRVYMLTILMEITDEYIKKLTLAGTWWMRTIKWRKKLSQSCEKRGKNIKGECSCGTRWDWKDKKGPDHVGSGKLIKGIWSLSATESHWGGVNKWQAHKALEKTVTVLDSGLDKETWYSR